MATNQIALTIGQVAQRKCRTERKRRSSTRRIIEQQSRSITTIADGSADELVLSKKPSRCWSWNYALLSSVWLIWRKKASPALRHDQAMNPA
ncbi:MAG: hypothetical protein R2856_32865 [Caldilineaceae bacterium]